MSALTGEWSVEKIRAVMVHLDRKTGLHGAELPIEMGKAVSYLGRYYCGERKSFYFSTHHLNDPAFRESEAIELIRHEYAHYYVDTAGLRPFFQDGRAHHHGPSWQYACKMVGASGRRIFGQELLPELTAAELVRRFRAEDVRAFDMCGYIRMWNRLPSEPQQSARWMAAVERNNHRDRVFYPGDEVLFPQRGFGRVLAMEPVPSGQLLYIRFESGVEETLHARYVCKVVDGVIKTVDVRRKRCV